MRNRLSPMRLRKRSPLLGIEGLEDRVVPAAILNITNAQTGIFPQFDLVDPNPNIGGAFGTQALFLSTGNVVVTDPNDNAGGVNAGAVYLFNGTTGALISTLTGSSANDKVGNYGVTMLTNGNYVVDSRNWANGAIANAGAVTWGNGTTGISGPVSAANSLVGSQSDDNVGNNGITTLTNGNYVVISTKWDNGAVVDAGAVTWGNGTTGINGAVSIANSLVGSHVADVSSFGVTALINGNYVVGSPDWNNRAGATTWADGTTGISGAISSINSLVGSRSDSLGGLQAGDYVGTIVTALTNGNYVVSSPGWANGVITGAGVATWGNGTTGIRGAVSTANSLVGSQSGDYVGNTVTALTNGNYVVSSPLWANGVIAKAGAVTWGNGATGIIGPVSTANSLVGSQSGDYVGIGSIASDEGVTALADGNYVVDSSRWDNGAVVDVGAVTWGNGTAGIKGAVTAANSLVGTQASDNVGSDGVKALTNGNYVVSSSSWNNGAATLAGAVTWGNGTTGIKGAVTTTNSLVGSNASDRVGNNRATALMNGNYVVGSAYWSILGGSNLNGNKDVGAATWGNGMTGTSGAVSPVNSLVGSSAGDIVGGSVTALTNGNYVVSSPVWTNGVIKNAGAATWGNGTTGISGTIDLTSLVGSTAFDYVGTTSGFNANPIIALSNGNYVVTSYSWNNGAVANVGAVTWGDGSNGNTHGGVITPTNSLLGIAVSARLHFGSASSDGKAFVANAAGDGSGRVVLGFPDANLLTFNRGGSKTLNVTPDLFASSLSAGVAIVSQATTAITVSAPIFISNPTGNGGALTLESQGTVNLNADIITDNGNLTLLGTTITPAVGVTVNTGTGTLNLPTGKLVLNQTLTVNGGVNLAGVSLNALLTLPSVPGQSVTLIDKQLAGAVVGTFAGLPQGASLTVNGLAYTIRYNGGDGNDVVLIRSTPPTISDVGNQTGNTNAVVGPVAFTINDIETPLAALTVTATSSNLALIANASIIIGGGAGSRTVTLTPTSGQSGISTITLTVTDGDGQTATDTFTMTVNVSVNAPPTISHVANQSTTLNVVNGPAVFTIGDTETALAALTVTATSSNPAVVANAGIDIGGSGANRTVTVNALSVGTSTITLTVTDAGGLTSNDTFVVTVNAPVVLPPLPPLPKPILVGVPQFAAGSDVGGGSATLFNPDKSVRFTVTPFAGFTGGVRTATADFNGDGVADLIVGTGPGIATQVVVYDGKTQAVLFDVAPFEASFQGGVYISAGDVTGDGNPDLAITPDEGGGPRVDIYSGAASFPKIAGFFGIDDTNFRGGARSAIADMTGDGVADLIVVAGFGGGPRVAAFDGKSLNGTPVKIIGDFFAFEQALRNGIFVTAGDINGDGFADLIAGGGPGGGPRVLVLDGKSLLSNQYVNLANFFGGDINSRGGIRVTVKNLDGDNKADLVVGSGSATGSRVTGYLGKNIAPDGTPASEFDFDAISGFTGGVFVG